MAYLHTVNAVSLRWFCTKCADAYASIKINILSEKSTCEICRPVQDAMLKDECSNDGRINTLSEFNRTRYWYSVS